MTLGGFPLAPNADANRRTRMVALTGLLLFALRVGGCQANSEGVAPVTAAGAAGVSGMGSGGMAGAGGTAGTSGVATGGMAGTGGAPPAADCARAAALVVGCGPADTCAGNSVVHDTIVIKPVAAEAWRLGKATAPTTPRASVAVATHEP